MDLTLMLIAVIALDAFIQLIRLKVAKDTDTRVMLMGKAFDSPEYVSERPMVFQEQRAALERLFNEKFFQAAKVFNDRAATFKGELHAELADLTQSIGSAVGTQTNRVDNLARQVEFLNTIVEPVINKTLEAEANKAAQKLASEIEYDLFRPPTMQLGELAKPEPKKARRKARRSRR